MLIDAQKKKKLFTLSIFIRFLKSMLYFNTLHIGMGFDKCMNKSCFYT